MFCRYCGKPLDDDARFCVWCGKPLRGAAAGVPPPACAPAATPGQPVRRDAPGWLWAMLAALPILLAVAAGIALWVGGSGEEAAPEPPKYTGTAPAIPQGWYESEPCTLSASAYARLARDAQECIDALLGERELTDAQAQRLFCADGPADGLAGSARGMRQQFRETYGAGYEGHALCTPLVLGEYALMPAFFYAADSGEPPLTLEDGAAAELCLAWNAAMSRWQVDLSARFWGAAAADPSGLKAQLMRPGYLQALEAGRYAALFDPYVPFAQPVIPAACDALPVAVWQNADGSYVVEYYAFNGTSREIRLDRVAEISLTDAGQESALFAAQGEALKVDLTLPAGTGVLVQAVVPAAQVSAQPQAGGRYTCTVWLTEPPQEGGQGSQPAHSLPRQALDQLAADTEELVQLLYYAPEPMTARQAAHCAEGLEQAGLSPQDAADRINQELRGTRGGYAGYAFREPLLAGRYALMYVTFYAGGDETLWDTVPLYLVWAQEEGRWKLDAPRLGEAGLHAEEAASTQAAQRARQEGRAYIRLPAHGLAFSQPVVPGRLGAEPLALYRLESGDVAVDFYAYNGTGGDVTCVRLAELSFSGQDGTLYFGLSGAPVEGCRLPAGTGGVFSVTVPASALLAPLAGISGGRCVVRLGE